ncbi:hypothetical protein CFC21_022201 [Triticum aestivum]|uniref:F-box domain-containing protein n=2 Tax=Triticum aestivum TaxID=4565 RepID=A0A3B6C1P3_WHEAT|nr:hypothetical protein CFC21_022201 [Triticum aestivum]
MRISLPWDVDVYATMGRHRTSEAEEIPSEMLQEILMKLPTKDVARCCRVSRQWRSAVRDPSFRKLHAASHAALSAESELLRVSNIGEVGHIGSSERTGVFSVSSGKAMCSVTIPHGYGLANICNGLLCFVDRDHNAQAPAVVCNPASGETLALPEAPPLSNEDDDYLFALGFSPPTDEYKLFRLSFPPYSYSSEERVDMDVYTLGDARGWRKDSFLSPSRPATKDYTLAPVLIDGKLHVVTRGWNQFARHEAAGGVLVLDVPAETSRTYPLPDNLGTYPYDNPLAFELKGRLCLAAHVLSGGRPKALRFWVMDNKETDDEKEPHWDLRYSFFVEAEHSFDISRPWSAWFEHETLCYTRSNTLHKYDTRLSIPDHSQLLKWNKQLQQTTVSRKWRWVIHQGYRPTLLSPHVFELSSSSQDETMMDICS